MAVSSVKSPFQQFFDLDGKPLEGKLYIGLPNQDAKQNPLMVYWDAEQQYPAAQPIKIVSGYPSRNGTPTLIYVTQSHSMLVENQSGRQVFYARELLNGVSGQLDAETIDFSPYGFIASTNVQSALEEVVDDLAAGSGSSLIGFIQSGTGAVARTNQSKARESVSVLDFGGVGDGIADDTAALQAAINEAIALGGADVYLPKKLKLGAITISGKVGIIGFESKTEITSVAGNYNNFTISSSDVDIKNLSIQDSAKTGGYDFIIACGSTGKDRINIDNVITYNSFGFITDSGTSNGVHTTTRLKQIQAKVHRGPGVNFSRLFAFIFLKEVTIDYVGTTSPNFTAFRFLGTGLPAGAGGLILDECDVLGTAGVIPSATQEGYYFQDLNAVRIICSRADTCGSTGWYFKNVVGVIFDDLAAGLCNGHGFVLENCTSVIGDKLFIFGRNYLSSPAANIDGLRFVAGNNAVNINNIIVRDMTGHGVHKTVAQAGPVQLGGLSSYANTLRGIKTVGDSGFIVTGFQFNANTAGNYDLGGAFDYLLAGQFASGAVSSVVGPGPVTG
jgi:hypothetical protein